MVGVAEAGATGVERFRMLETLRQFSSERLAFRNEADQIRRSHASHFLALAEEAEPLLETEGMAEWLNRLEAEHDNLRAALRWMFDAGQTIEALQMTTALSVWFWFLHRHHEEAHEWHARTLNAASDVPVELLADAYAKASMQAVRVRRFDRAGELADRALEYASTTGNGRAEIMALWTHGEVAKLRDYDDEAALNHFQQALGQAEDAQDDIWICRLAFFVSLILDFSARRDDGLVFASRSLDVGRRCGWPMGIAEAALRLATYALNDGDFDRASALAEESLRIEKELGDPWGIVDSYEVLAVSERMQGRSERAQALAREGLDTVGKRTDYLGSYPLNLELAASSLAAGHPHQAISANVKVLEAVRGTTAKYATARALSTAVTILLSQRQPDRSVRLFATAERLFDQSFAPERFTAASPRDTHKQRETTRTSEQPKHQVSGRFCAYDQVSESA